MALLSKLLQDFSQRSGIPALAVSRTVYITAIAGYIYNVAWPEVQRITTSAPDLKENDKKIVKKSPEESQEEPQSRESRKGPAVNR